MLHKQFIIFFWIKEKIKGGCKLTNKGIREAHLTVSNEQQRGKSYHCMNHLEASNWKSFIIKEPLYLQSEQVALQTVSYEDGFSTEHAEQHGLNISQTDGGVLQVLFRHTWKSVGCTVYTAFTLLSLFQRQI